YFEDPTGDDAVTGFYDERGRSLRRAFLRAPLQFRRVSSRFGARYHPILHMWRAHEGVDFSAASGTPVRATADGIVARVGRGDAGTEAACGCLRYRARRPPHPARARDVAPAHRTPDHRRARLASPIVELYPAVDVQGGRVARSASPDPLAVARQFARDGAR